MIPAPPLRGHTAQLLPHATHLKRQEYDVFFTGSAEFKFAIENTGATFIETEKQRPPVPRPKKIGAHHGQKLAFWSLRHMFLDSTPTRMYMLKTVLEELRVKYSDREVIILQEVLYMGAWPFVLGAPLPKGYSRFPKVISSSSVPLDASVTQHVPIGPDLPPGLNTMYEATEPVLAELTSYANATWGA